MGFKMKLLELLLNTMERGDKSYIRYVYINQPLLPIAEEEH